MPISFHTLSVELVQLAFCPKHWQLPKGQVYYQEANHDGMRTLMEAYGWSSWTEEDYRGPTQWKNDTVTYMVQLDPFYIVLNGTMQIKPLTGFINIAYFGRFWTANIEQTSQIAAAFSTGNIAFGHYAAVMNGESLRCLTQ